MSFNEKAARNIINFLLNDDTYDFKKWIPFIKKFNSEQIQNLFKGVKDYKYPVKNRDVFERLVLKFDNFESLLSKWYEKEENYKYLKQLWLKYIAIEDINEEMLNDLSEDKLTNFLESNNVNYSKWPEEVKKEFKEAIQEAIGTCIHEEEMKKKLNEEHSGLKKCFDIMNKLVNSLKNIFENTDKEAQKIFEANSSFIKTSIVGGLFSLIGASFFSESKSAINAKALKKLLIEQIQGYDISKVDAKKIANDIIKSNCYSDNNYLIWRVGYSDKYSLFDYSDIDGQTFHNSINADLELDLNSGSNSLPFRKKISAILKSEMVCRIVAIASFINLGFSVIEFNEISSLTEEIAGKEYRKQFNDIKEKFRDHLNELDLTNDCHKIKEKIIYVKNNIENDKKLLVDLITKIKADILLLERKRNESIISLIASFALGGGSILGTFLTSGGVSLGYAASTIFNIISGGINTKNISNCSVTIEELKKIQKEAEEEEKKIQKKIEELDLRLKQKELVFPTVYQDLENILQKQNKKLDNYIMNR